jgi:hypothetical protein
MRSSIVSKESSMKIQDRGLRVLSLMIVGFIVVHPEPAMAASLMSLGHAAGAQCSASDVNDSGVVVGSCKPGNTNGSLVAWVSTAGSQISLPPLTTGKGCGAGGIANSGVVIGSCLDAGSVPFAVTWSSTSPGTSPIKLAPLPGLLGLGADVSTSVGAYSQSGFVAGQSVGGNGNSTAVLWLPGSGTPVQVSGRGDNCAVVDVANSSSGVNPVVLLNCPSGTGAVTPKVATPTGLLGTYVVAALAKNSGSSYCAGTAINTSLQVIGTCVFSAAPFGRAAFWANPSATARVLNLPNFSGDSVGKRSAGMFLNDLGHLVYRYQMSDGRQNDGFSDPVNNVVLSIPPLHADATVVATALGDNDLVIVAGDNGSENTQAAIFNPASPLVVTPVPFFGGGAKSLLVTASKGGAYAVGTAEDGNHDANAVSTTLP